MRFHERHGTHVELSPCKTSAKRIKSFANAVVFSHRPLVFGETFLFEIEEQEKDWSGHVRCGITTHNPQTIKSVPPFLLPDMAQMGRTWVFAIKSTIQKPLGDEQLRDYGSHNFQRQEAGDKDTNPVFCGKKAREMQLRPTDVGSRIGVKVSPSGELYFFVNGIKFGPCALDVPVDKDLYVAVDVYGTTKKVQIIQCGGQIIVLTYSIQMTPHTPLQSAQNKRLFFTKGGKVGGWINLMKILRLKNIYNKIAKNFQGLTFKIGERNHKYGNHPGGQGVGGGGRGSLLWPKWLCATEQGLIVKYLLSKFGMCKKQNFEVVIEFKSDTALFTFSFCLVSSPLLLLFLPHFYLLLEN